MTPIGLRQRRKIKQSLLLSFNVVIPFIIKIRANKVIASFFNKIESLLKRESYLSNGVTFIGQVKGLSVIKSYKRGISLKWYSPVFLFNKFLYISFLYFIFLVIVTESLLYLIWLL